MNCPDTELLAAMVEEKLSSAERESLLLHLADCADCRRTVLLAPADRGTARRKFVARKHFPWGAVAAVVIIGLAGFFTWKLRPAPPAVPGLVSAPTPTPREDLPKPTPVPAPPPRVPVVPAPPPPAPDPTPQPSVIPTPAPDPTPAPLTPVPSTTPEPPKPTTQPAPPPRREIAAVRILDITGDLSSARKRVGEGSIGATSVTAISPASFRVNDNLVSMLKGTVATVGKSGTSLALEVESGEACVESQGSTWLLGDQEIVLKGAAIVSKTGVVLLSDLPAKEAATRSAPYKGLKPRQKTWIFEDFADKPGGVLTATNDMNGIRASLDLSRNPIPWSRKFTVKVRYRTNASQVDAQLSLLADGQASVAIAMNGAGKGWQELTIPAARFEVGQENSKEPPATARIVELVFLIDAQEAPKGKASLEIDDVVFIERE